MFIMATENKDILCWFHLGNIIHVIRVLGRFEVKSLVSFTLASKHDLSYTMTFYSYSLTVQVVHDAGANSIYMQLHEHNPSITCNVRVVV